MATEKQKAANQRNSQQSHGPTSEAGLAAIALNNFRHGMATKTNEHFGMLMDENPEKFQELLELLRNEHKPESETESLLVRHMAESEWLRARALRFQAECLHLGVNNVEPAKLAVFIRYQTTHQRAFHKALNELQSLREQKRKAEIGIEAQKLKQAAEIRAGEALNVKADAQNLKREEFQFKKEVFQAKQEAQQRRNVSQTAADVTPDSLKMAA